MTKFKIFINISPGERNFSLRRNPIDRKDGDGGYHYKTKTAPAISAGAVFILNIRFILQQKIRQLDNSYSILCHRCSINFKKIQVCAINYTNCP